MSTPSQHVRTMDACLLFAALFLVCSVISDMPLGRLWANVIGTVFLFLTGWLCWWHGHWTGSRE